VEGIGVNVSSIVSTPEVDELIATGSRFATAGMAHGSSGNLSVRLPDGHVVMTPTGGSLGSLERSDLSVLDPDGNHVSGLAPTKEWGVHLGIYADRLDVGAVVHLHSDAATAVACMNPWSPVSAIPPVTPYFVMVCGAAPRTRYAAPGSAELGVTVREALGFGWAALMANHGSVTVGADLAAAEGRAVELEKTCALVIAIADGRLQALSDDQIAELVARFDAYWPPATDTGG
jgi:ribulose-5-phosphate 4-epimerase/fuculose-1-phosphate aldolase